MNNTTVYLSTHFYTFVVITYGGGYGLVSGWVITSGGLVITYPRFKHKFVGGL
jgi:hypothetical protein